MKLCRNVNWIEIQDNIKSKEQVNKYEFREKNENWKKYRVWRRNVEEENYKKCKLIKENKW